MPLVKKQLGEYINGEFLKDSKIDLLTISTIPELKTGTYGDKLECSVTYQGFAQGKPYKWGMNTTCRNQLIDKYGENTDDWLNKTVPVETSITEKGRAIYIDKKALALSP